MKKNKKLLLVSALLGATLGVSAVAVGCGGGDYKFSDEAYIDGIEITGIELSNPAEGQNTEIRSAVQEDGRTLYAFTYVDGTYTTDEESLKNNPNRIKINYILQPDDAAKEYLIYTVDNDKVYISEETDELIFLKKVRVELYLKESRANMDVQDSIIIWAR